jgi:hypothetical protein
MPSIHDTTLGIRNSISNYIRKNRPFYDTSQNIIKMVVVDIVLENKLISEDYVRKCRDVFGVQNYSFIKTAPRNSVIAKFLNTSQTSSTVSDISFVVPPFFSSHLSLPLKPGEVIWCFVDNVDYEKFFQFYWISRITTKITTDDVNYSHFPDNFNYLFETEASTQFDFVERFSNFPVFNPVEDEEGNKIFSYNLDLVFLNKINTIDGNYGFKESNPFKSLFVETDASRLLVYEPVPRYQKRPGDLVLEGSNNTLIVLGTDRSGLAYNVQAKEHQIEIKNDLNETISSAKYNIVVPIESEKKFNAGSIDIVTGRGQTPKTSGEVISNELFSEIKKAIEIPPSNIKSSEGDPDFIHDVSRIYVSQNTNLDKKISKEGSVNFNASLLQGTNIDVSQDKGGILIKSDSVRLVARNDFQILIKNDDNTDSSSDSPDDYCSITLKSNGDIVLKPSKNGFIKLGSESANKPVFCSGLPSSSPIVSSLGSTIGAGGQNGAFSKKVLIE